MIALKLVWRGRVISRLDAQGHAADGAVCASVSVLLRAALVSLACWPETRLAVDARASGEGLFSWSLCKADPDVLCWLEGWSAMLVSVLRQVYEQRPAELSLSERAESSEWIKPGGA